MSLHFFAGNPSLGIVNYMVNLSLLWTVSLSIAVHWGVAWTLGRRARRRVAAATAAAAGPQQQEMIEMVK